MKIKWEKKGLIYVPNGNGFFKTHAARPIPYQIDDKVLRIYFTSRDSTGTMFPTYIDVDIKNPNRILHVNEKPLLNLGRIGTFDDSGVTLGCILTYRNEIFAYYSGWKRRRVVPYEISIGVCKVKRPDMTFERIFEGPILAQDKNHPILTAGPFVIYDQKKFKMWYCSGTEWRLRGDGSPEPIYRVHYAESEDGINWVPFKKPAIDYKFDGEVISAPWVLKVGSRYHMWYSYRGSATIEAKNYIIGYAESVDGIKWKRMDDQVGIEKATSGWDSEMICYPGLFPYDDVIYMFYSGNHVGKGGMGYAVSENFLK